MKITTRKQLLALRNKDGHIIKKGCKKIGVKMFDSGLIILNDVQLDACKPMTVRDAVKYLNL